MRFAPPPPVIRPPNAAADHQFVGAQLYLAENNMHPREGCKNSTPPVGAGVWMGVKKF